LLAWTLTLARLIWDEIDEKEDGADGNVEFIREEDLMEKKKRKNNSRDGEG
jgi:hypothetical protein